MKIFFRAILLILFLSGCTRSASTPYPFQLDRPKLATSLPRVPLASTYAPPTKKPLDTCVVETWRLPGDQLYNYVLSRIETDIEYIATLVNSSGAVFLHFGPGGDMWLQAEMLSLIIHIEKRDGESIDFFLSPTVSGKGDFITDENEIIIFNQEYDTEGIGNIGIGFTSNSFTNGVFKLTPNHIFTTPAELPPKTNLRFGVPESAEYVCTTDFLILNPMWDSPMIFTRVEN